MVKPEESSHHPRVYAWFYAFVAEDTTLLDELLAHGLPVDVEHPLRRTTALMEAVRLGRTALVSWLLKHGAAPAHLSGVPRGTPLHCAVSLKRWEIAELLLAALNEAAVVDGYGRTPLHLLCMEPFEAEAAFPAKALATRMIDKACPLDALDQEGISALHYCTINGHEALAALLLKRGATANILIPDSKVSPIVIAALEKNLPLATLLLEHGADPNLPTRDGMTAASLMPAIAHAGGH